MKPEQRVPSNYHIYLRLERRIHKIELIDYDTMSSEPPLRLADHPGDRIDAAEIETALVEAAEQPTRAAAGVENFSEGFQRSSPNNEIGLAWGLRRVGVVVKPGLISGAEDLVGRHVRTPGKRLPEP